ncbi:predicted protein [Postia placenta Mad-698-R]|nr:predicted protein [Postia placenta Mad-698-R]
MKIGSVRNVYSLNFSDNTLKTELAEARANAQVRLQELQEQLPQMMDDIVAAQREELQRDEELLVEHADSSLEDPYDDADMEAADDFDALWSEESSVVVEVAPKYGPRVRHRGMSSVTIDVPPGTVQIVLKFQSEETEQLRRRLRAAEGWSKDCNASLAAEVARLTRESANAQTLIQQWEGSFTQTSQLPQNEVETCESIGAGDRRQAPLGPDTPLFGSRIPPGTSTQSPNTSISPLTLFDIFDVPLGRTQIFGSVKHVFVNNEAVWESPYDFGYLVKPTRMRSKKGNWREAQDNKLTGSHNELSAIVSAMRCYLGTYERVSAVVMTKGEFDSLPTQVREAVIQASSNPKHHSETRRLYETGQVLPRKINFRRVGFNHAFAQALLDAAHVCGLLFGTSLNQHEVQKCSPWIVLNIQNGELDRLRRRLEAAENVNALGSGLQPVQTTGSLFPSANPQDGPVDDAPITFCLERNPKEYLKAAKVSCGAMTIVKLRDDVVWGEFPSSGFLVRPTRIRTKKGNWNKVQNKKLLRDKMEFAAYNGFEWKYLGTFASANTDSEELSREAFIALPDQTREQLIRLSGHKRHRTEVKPMYESGEMVGMKFSFRRIGFNHALGEMLRGVGKESKGGKTLKPEIGYSIIFFFREVVELELVDRGHNLDEEAAKDIAQKQLDYERRVHQEYSDYPEHDAAQFAHKSRIDSDISEEKLSTFDGVMSRDLPTAIVKILFTGYEHRGTKGKLESFEVFAFNADSIRQGYATSTLRNLIGSIIGTFLYGVTCAQTLYYMRRYSLDRIWLKLFCIWIWNVTNHANPLALLTVERYFIYCIWRVVEHRQYQLLLTMTVAFVSEENRIPWFLGTLHASPFELIWLAFHYPGSKLYVNSLFAFRIDSLDTLETMYYLVSIKEDKQDTVRIHTLCRFKSRQLRQPKRTKKMIAIETTPGIVTYFASSK